MKLNIHPNPKRMAALTLLCVGLWILTACSAVIQSPTPDLAAQVATIIAATQAAQPTALPPTAIVEPTATSGPQKVVLQLSPDLQNLLQTPQSLLKLYAIQESTQAQTRLDVTGGAGTTQFELTLAPGTYRFVAWYSPIEGFELLGLWTADGSAQRVEVSQGQPAMPLLLSRPTAPCLPAVRELADLIGEGSGYAQVQHCNTSKLTVSFDSTVQNPPSAAIYAEGLGMFATTISQDVASAPGGTAFVLDVPPGDYLVYARSLTASDPSFFGAWSSQGLATIRVEHNSNVNVYLTRPGDPCLEAYQLGATPDGRFPETKAYREQLKCGEETTSVGGEEQTMGAAVLGRNPDGIDSFKEGNFWYQYEDDNYSFEVKDGQMVMVGKKTNLNDAWVTRALKLKDFYLEATFKMGSECSGRDRYGLLVRAPDPGVGYVIEFSCAGQFRLYYMDDGKYKAVQEWKSSDLIVQGANATNRMGVWMKGNSIKLYANGKLIGEYTDDAFDEGIIGVLIGPAETSGLEARVDEIQYWEFK